MARLGRGQPNPPVIVRSSLQDPPVLTTPAPVVVTHLGIRARPAFGQPNQALTVRSTLADPPALTTPSPVVVSTTVKRPAVLPIILRSGTEDAVVVTATPGPVVVTPPPRRTLPGLPIIGRGSLEDFATPPPVVVAAPRRPVIAARPIAVRGSVEDPAVTTAQPLVITAPALRSTGRVILARGPLDTTPPPTPTGPGITLELGPAAARWHAGTPTVRWPARLPSTRWTASPPEV